MTSRDGKDFQEWLDSQEDAELAKDLEERRREWEREGGVEVGELFRSLKSRRAGQAQSPPS